jgi:hypothetical protein
MTITTTFVTVLRRFKYLAVKVMYSNHYNMDIFFCFYLPIFHIMVLFIKKKNKDKQLSKHFISLFLEFSYKVFNFEIVFRL